MILLALPSGWLAARLALHLDSGVLMRVFSVFLLGLSGYFFWGHRSHAEVAEAKAPWPLRYLPLVGLISGFSAGLFTVGAGLVAAPLLVRGFRLPMAQAQGIALSLVVPGALVSLWTYAQADQVQWSTGLLLALGGALSVSSGVALAHRLPERQLKRGFALMLFATASWMVHISLQ
jgi:uncharacterized membrane protein YfcA